jgi:hypothetical protein
MTKSTKKATVLNVPSYQKGLEGMGHIANLVGTIFEQRKYWLTEITDINQEIYLLAPTNLDHVRISEGGVFLYTQAHYEIYITIEEWDRIRTFYGFVIKKEKTDDSDSNHDSPLQ